VKEVHDITVYEHGGTASVSLHLKFAADLDLDSALAVAGRIEQAIHARPGVSEVQTHLEPLERPLVVRPVSSGGQLDCTNEIERIVAERTGAEEPGAVKLLCTDAGSVVFR